MTAAHGIPIFDADSHMYETAEALTQFLPERYRRGASVSDVVETVGWDRVMFGSDYPHPEGLPEPKAYWKYAEGMDNRRTWDFLGDNARRFVGLPIENPDPSALEPPAEITTAAL